MSIVVNARKEKLWAKRLNVFTSNTRERNGGTTAGTVLALSLDVQVEPD